jgi:hypothetical protein
MSLLEERELMIRDFFLLCQGNLLAGHSQREDFHHASSPSAHWLSEWPDSILFPIQSRDED